MAQHIGRLRQRREQGQSGFTLIELLVVIVILGILSAVVVFAVRGVGDKGSSAAQATDAKTLRTAEEAFCAKNGYYAPDVATLVGAQLLSPGTAKLDSISSNTGSCTANADPANNKPSGFNIVCTVSSSNNCQAAVAAGAVATGGTMVLSAGTLAGPYNPAASSSGNTHPLDEAMFNGLLAFDPSGNVVPDLAAAMPTVVNNGDGTQDVHVVLRSGMLWQDGQPITNADVVFSYSQALLRQGRTGSSMGPAMGFNNTNPAVSFSGGSITPEGGSLGVDFHFLYPYSPLFRQMNVTEAPIIPQHVYAHCAQVSAGGDATYHDTLLNTAGTICPENNVPVGSGPFVWGGQTGGATGFITLNRNPNYFKNPTSSPTGLPYLSKVVLQNSTTAATSLAASRGSAGSLDTAGISAAQLTSPFNFTTSSNYSIASVPRGSGGSSCINTISFNLWQPTVSGVHAGTTSVALPEFGAGDPGIVGGLPGTAPAMDQAAVAAAPSNAYNNPILSSGLVRKALFEGFNRAQAAINDTGVATAVNGPVGTARMADSIYDSNLAGAYAPTTFPGGTGGSLGQPTVAQANTDLDAAGWDGGIVTDSNGVPVRTWGNHPTFPQQATLGLVPGTQLKLDISHFTGATIPVVAVQFISDMKVIGVDVIDRNNLVSPAWPAVEGARNFEIGIVSYCDGDDPVIGVQRQYLSSVVTNAYAANTTGYHDLSATPGDSTMDGLWYQANRATTPAARTAIYAQIQALAVSTNTQIPVSESVTNRVTRTVCGGLNNQNTGLFVETAYCSG